MTPRPLLASVPAGLVAGLFVAVVSAAPSDDSGPTWSADVAPLVRAHCEECHRPGGAAPMSLVRFEEARPWARAIAREVERGAMPPWHADPRWGRFANARALSSEQRETILSWVAAGAPPGDPAREPPPREFPGRWHIGEPDLVISLPEEVAIPAEGELPYHDYRVDTGFEQDVWIRGAEALPGNPEVVHHIIVGYAIDDPLQRARLRREGLEGRAQGSLGGYVPGDEPWLLPDGLGRRIPAGAQLYFQMHYTPNGEPTTDRSSLGLVLLEEPPKHEVRTGLVSTPFLHIPAGAPETVAEAKFRFERDSVLLSMRPHLHLRGKSFEYRARYPDGREEILLRVPDWDFDWQTHYLLAEPKAMPAGTELIGVAIWDNSADNPDNPDPGRTASWGQQTDDEMMIGFFEYYELGEG